MRWIIRIAAFLLSFALGISLWQAASTRAARLAELAQRVKAESIVHESIVQKTIPSFPTDVQQDPSQIYFVPNLPEPVTGYANMKTVRLLESPEANAAVLQKLQMVGYDSAEILSASGRYLYVRFKAHDGSIDDEAKRERDYEGWTTLEAIAPDLSAIVLDTETGRMVARLPLPDIFSSSATYSSDGSRVLFQSWKDIYEVRADDYTLSRSLKLSGNWELETVFYGATGDQLYAAIRPGGSSEEKLTLVRINGDGSTESLMEFTGASGFTTSPDAHTGFVIQRMYVPGYQVKIGVVDLQTLSLRNWFTLSGDGSQSLHSHNVVTNENGSELYVRLSSADDSISVIDTQTGQRVRELHGNLSGHSWVEFGRGDLVGGSVLVTYCDAGEDEVKGCWRRAWVGDDGRSAAQQVIESAVESGGGRFAVNAEGTRLFKLDNKNRVRESFAIERPEKHIGAGTGNDLSVFGLNASPDGKRVILFVGLEHGC